MSPTSRPVVFAVTLVVLLLMAFPFIDHTVDDAFISFRYADNLVSGHGLVFNPGERVEGYTNFLWCLLIAPFIAMSIDPELAARGLGLVASAALLAGVVRFSPKPVSAPEIVWVAPLLTAVSPAIAVWASGGMEAPLFACLVVWSAGLAAHGLSEDRLHPAAALLAAAATLTRPEGLGLFAVLALLLLALRRGRPNAARDFARWCGLFGIVFVPYFAWRWTYYGDLLPNTFYAKVGFNGAQVVRGLEYYGSFLAESGWWLLLPLVGLVWSRDRTAVVLFGGLFAALGTYVALVGGDGLPMYRFLVPVLPLWFLLIALAAAGLVSRFAPGRSLRLLGAVLVLALCARSAVPAFAGPALRYVEQDRWEVSAWKEMGRYLATSPDPNASVAVIAAGALPYFSGLPAIDMLGLNDRSIAHREMPRLGTGQAGHEKYDVDYVLDREPTYVFIGAYGMSAQPRPAQELIHPFYGAETEMLRSARFRSSYRLVRARTAAGFFAFFVRTVDAE